MASFHLHIKLRSAIKHVKCDVCDKLFKNYFVMVVHKRMHFEERPYKCVDCDEHFFCSSHLKSHHQLHKHENRLPVSEVVSCNLKNVNQRKTYTGKV